MGKKRPLTDRINTIDTIGMIITLIIAVAFLVGVILISMKYP